MVKLMPLPSPHPHHLLPHLNPDWFLPFWYWLTQVVLEKRQLNGCSISSIGSIQVVYWVEVHRLLADNRYRPIIGQFVNNRYWPFWQLALADNRPIIISFEWMRKCFSVVRRQDSGTARARPNRILEFPCFRYNMTFIEWRCVLK